MGQCTRLLLLCNTVNNHVCQSCAWPCRPNIHKIERSYSAEAVSLILALAGSRLLNTINIKNCNSHQPTVLIKSLLVVLEVLEEHCRSRRDFLWSMPFDGIHFPVERVNYPIFVLNSMWASSVRSHDCIARWLEPELRVLLGLPWTNVLKILQLTNRQDSTKRWLHLKKTWGSPAMYTY